MMTIGGWMLFGFIAIILLGIGVAVSVYFWGERKKAGSAISLTLAVLLIVLAFTGLHWYYNSTQSGARAMKDQESNLGNGLVRTVDIYDMEGDLIKTYSGQFDVEMHDTHIVFDDENGKRHTVYFTTGTVVIDEK